MDGICRLGEHRKIVGRLVKHRDGGQREGIGHQVFDALAIMAHIDLAQFRRVFRTGHTLDEIGICLLNLLKLDAFLGTADSVVAKGVGLDIHLVALLQKQSRNSGITTEKIHELRLFLSHIHFVAERAIGLGLDGIKDIVGVDIELLDHYLRVGSTVDSAADTHLLGAGNKRERNQRKCYNLITFHILH